MQLMLQKYWKHLLGGLLLVVALYSGFITIKTIGYNEAMQICNENTTKYEKDIANKTKAIEVMSNVLLEQQKLSTVELNKNINVILQGVKAKPLTIIKNGECIPSKEFSDSFSEINRRVNESIP